MTIKIKDRKDIDLAGKGRKRPLLNLPLTRIDLDNQNPRLPEEYQGGTQEDVFKVLYTKFDLEELAFSMAENGYFDEEPIVVVPENLPKTFPLEKYDDVNELQIALEELISRNDNIRFTAVEGNRRTATARLLTDETARQLVGVGADFPKPKNRNVEDDLKIIPSIFYKHRKEISPYLGVRHITGILKWDAYAKARYIASRIEDGSAKGKNTEEKIKDVQRKIGDRSDVIKKQYMNYKVVQQTEDDTNFDVGLVQRRFSLITLALGYESIRNFIGIPSYKEANLDKPIVPKRKLENLETLLTWIYGNGKDKQAIFTDSRKISQRLAPILADKDATDYLLKYGNLEEAYERSGGEKKFLIKKINDAKRNLAHALGIAYKYKKESEVKAILKECDEAMNQLRKMVFGND